MGMRYPAWIHNTERVKQRERERESGRERETGREGEGGRGMWVPVPQLYGCLGNNYLGAAFYAS